MPSSLRLNRQCYQGFCGFQAGGGLDKVLGRGRLVLDWREQFSRCACGSTPAFGRAVGSSTGGLTVGWEPGPLEVLVGMFEWDGHSSTHP
jgi:hypothetical protein